MFAKIARLYLQAQAWILGTKIGREAIREGFKGFEKDIKNAIKWVKKKLKRKEGVRCTFCSLKNRIQSNESKIYRLERMFDKLLKDKIDYIGELKVGKSSKTKIERRYKKI